MRFRWLTDPHLDHAPPAAVAGLLSTLRDAPGIPLILTGDLSISSRLLTDLERLADAAAAPLYHVLGNHDHYGASVGEVRDRVLGLAARRPEIAWLPPVGVIALDATTRLVGVDGWADGRHGDPVRTPIRLNDDRLIAELAGQSSRTGRLVVRRTLADADAQRLRILLERATTPGVTHIVVATHVPPFVDGLAPGARIAHRHWHPVLVCGATGTVLRHHAREHPDLSIEVLAGHTHAAADVMVQPNLRLRVGGARYGTPALQDCGH